MFKIIIPSDDPECNEKIKVIPLLENIYRKEGNTVDDIVDLSGISCLSKEELTGFKDKKVLISPEEFSKAGRGDNMLPAYPWRHWSVIHSLRQFIKSGDAGDMVSFRIIINLPGRLSRGEKYFYNNFIPEIIDLCCYISSSGAEEIHINRVKGRNICFILLKFSNYTVAEIDINEALPDSMEPVRFVRAYFTNGIFTNMPLGGDLNVEGSLIATADKVERFIHEHMDHDKGDELNNLYFRMLYDIVNGLYIPEAYTDFRIIQKAVQCCLLDNSPCKIKDIT